MQLENLEEDVELLRGFLENVEYHQSLPGQNWRENNSDMLGLIDPETSQGTSYDTRNDTDHHTSQKTSYDTNNDINHETSNDTSHKTSYDTTLNSKSNSAASAQADASKAAGVQKRIRLNQSPDKKTTQSYMSQLSKDEKYFLEEVFINDFKLFGYDPQKYTNTWKNYTDVI